MWYILTVITNLKRLGEFKCKTMLQHVDIVGLLYIMPYEQKQVLMPIYADICQFRKFLSK